MSSHKKNPAVYCGRIGHAINPPRPSKLKRFLSAALALAVSFTVTAATLIYTDLSNRTSKITVAKVLNRTPPDSYSGKPINLLVIGSDTRSGKENQELGGGNDPTERSDTTMLMHISADRSRVEVVSIPRDLLVNIPACKLADNSLSKPRRAQFNWAYSIGFQGGNRATAVACTWKTVEQLTGLKVDESILVDFSGFASMINALGGINIYIPTEIKDSNTGLDLKPGCKHFDGKQALEYARVRHGVKGSDGSDLHRIQRQQQLMGIMARTALNKNILTSLNQLYGFLGSGLASLTVSEGLSSTTELGGLGWSLQSIKPDNLRFVTLPTYPAPLDPNRVVVKENETRPIWDAFKKDTSLPAGIQVRDGNNKVYTISADETAPSSKEPQSTVTDSASATPSETPTSSKSSSTGKRDSKSPNIGITPEELAQLQRKCEAGN